MGQRRVYTEEERASAIAVVAAERGSTRRASAKTGIPEKTLRMWRDGERQPQSRVLSAQKYMRPNADYLDSIAAQLAELLPERFETMTGPQLAVVMGICIDKAAILRATASQIISAQEQPIDLSRLTPEQLETLSRWLESGGRSATGGESETPGVQ